MLDRLTILKLFFIKSFIRGLGTYSRRSITASNRLLMKCDGGNIPVQGKCITLINNALKICSSPVFCSQNCSIPYYWINNIKRMVSGLLLLNFSAINAE